MPASPLTQILLSLTMNHTEYFLFFYYLFIYVCMHMCAFFCINTNQKSLFCKHYENTGNSMRLQGVGARNATAPRDNIFLNPALIGRVFLVELCVFDTFQQNLNVFMHSVCLSVRLTVHAPTRVNFLHMS